MDAYQRAMDAATARYAPLIDALRRELEVEPEVYQSGGFVMLLRVQAGAGDRCAMFGDFYDPDDPASVGLYRDWNDPDDLGVIAIANSIHHASSNADLLAAWAAPLILAWAAGHEPVAGEGRTSDVVKARS